MRKLLLILFLVLAPVPCTLYPSFATGPLNLPTVYDMVILAGADHILTVAIKDSAGVFQNISGSSYKAQFRAAPAPGGALFTTFSTVKRNASISGQTVRVVDVRLSKAQTTALSGKSGVWDLRQTDSAGLISYILTGKAAVRPTVTQ